MGPREIIFPTVFSNKNLQEIFFQSQKSKIERSLKNQQNETTYENTQKQTISNGFRNYTKTHNFPQKQTISNKNTQQNPTKSNKNTQQNQTKSNKNTHKKHNYGNHFRAKITGSPGKLSE